MSKAFDEEVPESALGAKLPRRVRPTTESSERRIAPRTVLIKNYSSSRRPLLRLLLLLLLLLLEVSRD